MTPNPVLRRLGLSDSDRAVIIHADDLGMCHSTLSGLERLFAAGIVSSGSIMVCCPWFRAAAAFASAHPEADLGAHLTLNCEWRTYRWGPLSTVDPASGLLDAEGYLPATAREVQERGDPSAVARELQAQIERALGAGIRLTHADTHMGTVAHARFMESYVSAALSRGLPPMLLRLDEEGWRAVTREHAGAGLDEQAIRRAVRMMSELEERGVPLLDAIMGMSLSSDPRGRLDEAKERLRRLAPGVTHFIIHPAADSPELRGITHDWGCRAADLETFAREELGAFLRGLGIHVIGYRRLQQLMRV